jgi:hypothetical protein
LIPLRSFLHGPAAWFLAVGLTLLALEARAAEAPPSVAAGRAEAPIRLDGLLDEEAWRHAGIIPDLAQQDPHPGEATRFRTEVRLLQDGANLYVGVICTDPEPEKVAIHTMLRDGDMSGDDTVALVIDTFEDARTGYYFRINAAGARQDGLVAGSEGASLDWDGIWDARTRRTAGGWSAEIVIPSKTLRFRSGSGSWGLNVERAVAREKLVLRWAGTTLDSSFYDLKRAGRLLAVSGMNQGASVSISPYFLGRREARFGPSGSSSGGEGGLDVAYNLTSELAAVATVHTDFAETEVDTRQINLTRFPLFFPEKRSFFLEGGNEFAFGSGLGLDPDFIPFFTRRVGLFEGQPIPIRDGLKLVGRHGPVGVGLLDVETDDSPRAPATNLFAGMVTLDASSHLRFGAIATDGDPSGRGTNWLGGVNAVWRSATFLGDKNLVGGAWTSRTGGEPAGDGVPFFDRPGIHPATTPPPPADARRSGWGFNIEYPNDLWYFFANYKDLGGDLNPALGFIPRPGTRQIQFGDAYQPRPKEGWWGSFVRQFFFETYVTYVTDLKDRPESWRIFIAPFNITSPRGAHAEVNWEPQYERLDKPFEVAPGVVIPAGDYHFTRYRIELDSSTFRPWRVGTNCIVGEFFDGGLAQTQSFVGFTTPGGHLELNLAAELDYGDLREGSFTERLLQLKEVYAFTPEVVLSSFVQYDSETRNLGINSRLRWTIRPGTDLFIVWNRGWERPLPDPGDLTLAPIADEVVLKLQHTWRP